VEEATRKATSRLHIKEVIGAVDDGRLGFGYEKVRWFSSECDTNRRIMVVDEIRAKEEERRITGTARVLVLVGRDRRAQCNL